MISCLLSFIDIGAYGLQLDEVHLKMPAYTAMQGFSVEDRFDKDMWLVVEGVRPHWELSLPVEEG